MWNQYQEGHDILTTTVPSATRLSLDYFKDNSFEVTEDVYNTILGHMAKDLEEVKPYVSLNESIANGPSRHGASTFSLSYLPPIQLPPFDGSYTDWENFRDRFTALIIKNKDLTDFSRMHFLTSCLKCRDLASVRIIPVTADNFEVAWRTLIAKYENPQRLISIHISTLLNLSVVTRESASELRLLRDNVNIAIASLRSLNRSPAELWDDILVHFVSQKFNPVTRKAWTMKTSDWDEPPS